MNEVKTSKLIKALSERVNRILPTYYEEAPSKADKFPYAVISGIHITDLESGDLVSFYIDLWADEKKPNATSELELLCDTLRNELTEEVIDVPGTLLAHLCFESQSDGKDEDFDLNHRRLSMAARAFYYKEV